MNQTGRIALLLALLLQSCSSGTASTTTAFACLEPPADQVVDNGVLPIEVRPNPAAAGSVVEILTGEIRLPQAAVIGIGLDLQCWTGNGWTNFYRLTRDSLGEPTAIPYGGDVEFAEPDLGLSLPNRSKILIPDVVPGIYRIWDTAVASGREFPGFAYLEVMAP